ncbi:MAG TPA: metalloregulator ArsR/SmtB family transcription factor, partial [Methanobacterium sp.]|nr:metalloregulator ArsR/SmtB family transcription factor [Methanobacterium sp.]
MLRINSQKCTDISEDLEELFKALGNINRLLIVYRLASGEMEQISVTEMARIMGLTQPAASQHLKILKTAQILHAKKDGNHIYYTFNENSLHDHKEKIDFLFGCLFIKCQ